MDSKLAEWTQLFIKNNEKDILICQIYVDDIIFGSTNKALCQEFGEMMTKEFEMSMMGELSFFLGFQIKQLREGTFIYQEKYCKDLLKKFKMEDCMLATTPIPPKAKLCPAPTSKKVDITEYRSMIGSLLYLCASRPDIMFSVCLCARYQADPKESYRLAVQRILRYLKYAPSIGLWYPKSARLELIGYSYADYAGCVVD